MASATPHPDFSRSPIARYVQLAALFRRLIETSVWPVGSQIPTVAELAEEYGVARATIRQALGLLGEEKLIERFRAKGTFVTRKGREKIWCAIPTDWSGLLLPSSDDATIEVLSKSSRGAPLPVPHELGIADDLYYRVQRRHWRGDKAFLVADVYIAESLRSQVNNKDLRHKTAMRIAADLLGADQTGDARHTITVGTADMLTAQLLSISVNAPVVHVRREVADQAGRLIVMSDGIFPGDIVRIDIKLRSSPD